MILKLIRSICHFMWYFLKVSLLENVIRSKFTYYFAICGFFILPKYHTWFSFHMLPFKGHISARKCYYTKIYILFCDLQILYFVKTFFYIFYIFLQTENLWRHNVHYHILKGTLWLHHCLGNDLADEIWAAGRRHDEKAFPHNFRNF